MKYNYIFVSSDIPDGISEYLSGKCKRLIKLKSNRYLPTPVSKHADMQLLNIENTLIMTEELYNTLELGNEIIIAFSSRNHTDLYPNDVNLNALLVGKLLLCNAKAVDEKVYDICNEKGISIINVKQGYAKCSTLLINDNAIITADKSIIAAADKNGLDCLEIEPGAVSLTGYDYGFIGGASFYDSYDKMVYFFGDIKKHPSYTLIYDFCSKHNTQIASLSEDILTDYGGAVAI